MKVSGSILAVKDNYEGYARELQVANIDFLHVDIFQEKGEFRIEDLLKFDKSYLPLDVHLIYEKITEKDIEILNRADVRFLNVQYETLENKNTIAEIGKNFNGNFGIAITAKTPIDIIDKYIKVISQVLFMCSEPGISGAKFDECNFERINEVHEKYPSLELYADGGINNKIAERMGKLGISLIVSGSYLSRNIESLNSNAYCLKYLNEENIMVRRNMIGLNALPVLKREASFMQIINIMNEYRLGMVFVVEDNVLKGIIGDGDIRRGFMKYGEEIFKIKAEDLMNRTPFTIESNKTMKELLEKIAQLRKGIDVIPVMEDNKIIGAIDIKIGI